MFAHVSDSKQSSKLAQARRPVACGFHVRACKIPQIRSPTGLWILESFVHKKLAFFKKRKDYFIHEMPLDMTTANYMVAICLLFPSTAVCTKTRLIPKLEI